MTSLVCGNLKKAETNRLIYKTDSENELMVSGGGMQGRDSLGDWSTCTLWFICHG